MVSIYTRGTTINPLTPAWEDIHITDIAHALSNICRWGGASVRHYSVAEHSIMVARRVYPEQKLQALLHDAAEAYLGDIPAPLKPLLRFDIDGELRTFEQVETRLLAVILQKFDCPARLAPEVKAADLIERDFELRTWVRAEMRDTPLTMSPQRAYREFMTMFETLRAEQAGGVAV